MYYPREERETLLLFDEIEMQWKFRSTSPKHIEKLAEIADIQKAYTDDEGRVIDIEGWLAPSQIRLYDTPSQKQKEHLAKMRARRLE